MEKSPNLIPEEIKCSYCSEELELDEDERATGQIICPACNQNIVLLSKSDMPKEGYMARYWYNRDDYGGYWRRHFAIGIDLTILTILFNITSLFLSNLSAIFYFLIILIYFLGTKGYRGQTLGYQILGIKIISVDGKRVTLLQILIRLISSIFSELALGLGYIWLVFDKNRQTWHDKIAGTYVIRTKALPTHITEVSQTGLIKYKIVIFQCLLIPIAFFVLLNLLKYSDAYKTAEDYIRKNPAVENIVGSPTDLSLSFFGKNRVDYVMDEAVFTIKVSGTKGKIVLTTELWRRDDVWIISGAGYTDKDGNYVDITEMEGYYFQGKEEEYYVKGIEYGIQGKYDIAQVEFEKALKIDSLFSPAREGLKIVEDVFKQKIIKDVAILMFKGIDYGNKGNWDAAIGEISRALEINPDYAIAYNERGINYGKKGFYDRAIEDFNKALQINPRYAVAYYNRGFVYDEKDFYDQAITDYSRALEINQEYAKAYCNRGISYGKKGFYDKAIDDFSKALKINPEFAEAYCSRGHAFYLNGLYDQAIVDYNKALEINPAFAEAYFNKALACEGVGSVNESIRAYKNFIQHSPPNFSGQIQHAKQRIKNLELNETTKMHIRAILVKTKTEAQEILQKLNSGANFSELAKQYSIGPGKEKGGDLGYFAPGDMMKELNDVAVKLKVGQCSGIIETSDGYFVIKKTGGITPSITRE
jgi:tetratricopeptide (TPR) repeat protein/DNA-directed RNA polymerase subunit RPC12/RpoP